MKLTRFEVMELNHVLNTTNYEMPIRPQYRYMVTQNIKITKQEIDAVNEAFPLPNGTVEYRNSREEITKKYASKESPLPEETQKEYSDEITALELKYKTLLDELKVYESERNAFLAETVDLPIRTVKLDDCPVISAHNKYNHWDIWNVIEKVLEV